MALQTKKEELAKAIRHRRRERDLTQEELAESLGFKSKATISKIESAVTPIDWRTILLVATHLKDSRLLAKWWEFEKARLTEDSEELEKPLAVMDELFVQLDSEGAFSEIDV